MASVFPVPTHTHSSIPSGEDWRRLQRRVAARVPELSLDRGSVTVSWRPKGYLVTLEGRDLHPAVTPPHVTVGGVTAVDLRFSADGRKLRGRLPSRPPNGQVVVDYRSARAELTLDLRLGWWRWIRPAVLELWNPIDRAVRGGP